MPDGIPVLVVTGPIGAGKTTIVGELSELLENSGVPHAACDFDALTQVWPPPPQDRFNLELGVRNLRCFWANCAEAGASCLVLAMTIETEAERQAITDAIPNAVVVFVRLSASLDELERRIRTRELGSARDWHVRRSAELQSIMDSNDFEAAVVATDGRSVVDIAWDVLQAAGWDVHGELEAT